MKFITFFILNLYLSRLKYKLHFIKTVSYVYHITLNFVQWIKSKKMSSFVEIVRRWYKKYLIITMCNVFRLKIKVTLYISMDFQFFFYLNWVDLEHDIYLHFYTYCFLCPKKNGDGAHDVNDKKHRASTT